MSLVWQIAQRDYKFGKGKHSSLTKATYDAIGDKFRSLWGREAGWAHSVLFTADLRTFSERVAVKSEGTEMEIKDEAGATVLKETQVKADVRAPVTVKREYHEDDSDDARIHAVVGEKITSSRKVKRRRKT